MNEDNEELRRLLLMKERMSLEGRSGRFESSLDGRYLSGTVSDRHPLCISSSQLSPNVTMEDTSILISRTMRTSRHEDDWLNQILIAKQKLEKCSNVQKKVLNQLEKKRRTSLQGVSRRDVRDVKNDEDAVGRGDQRDRKRR